MPVESSDAGVARKRRATPRAAAKADGAMSAFVRSARTALKESQRQFAERVGRSKQTIMSWEHGKTIGDYETLVAIAAASGVELPVIAHDLTDHSEFRKSVSALVEARSLLASSLTETAGPQTTGRWLWSCKAKLELAAQRSRQEVRESIERIDNIVTDVAVDFMNATDAGKPWRDRLRNTLESLTELADREWQVVQDRLKHARPIKNEGPSESGLAAPRSVATVELTASAFDLDAKNLLSSGDEAGAAYATRAANVLRRVAAGENWVAAFGWGQTNDETQSGAGSPHQRDRASWN